MSDTPREQDDMLAAEYALRLLQDDDLAEAERRVREDRDFAERVNGWEAQLVGMSDQLSPLTPSPAAKKAIMANLFPDTAPVRFWQRIGVWQGISLASLAVLAAVFLADFNAAPDVAGPLYSAEIQSKAGDFRVVAVVDTSTNEVFMTRTAGAAPSGRILQVWAHGPNAPAISVGLWPEGDSVRLTLPKTIAAVTDVLTLGVSEEPVGGSLTGSPSGRVFGTVDITK